MFNNIGNILKSINSFEDAWIFYQKALQIRPKDPITFFNIGNYFSKRNDSSQAIEYYKRSLEIDPEYSDAWHNLGVMLVKI